MRDALRPVVALCVVSLVAAAVPGSAAADTPSISSSIDGIAGNNAWWRGSAHGNNVILHWTVTANPPLTNSTGCDPAITIPGPTAGVTKTCTASNDDGTSSSSRMIKIDGDPPTGVAATPARAPDANGWYNQSVGLTWGGNDATSGISNCTTSSYSGPDTSSTSVPGNCQDLAGNMTSAPFSLKYDATDPSVSVSPSRGPNPSGWYTSMLTITSSGTDAVSGLGTCTPQASYSGPDSGTAAFTGTCQDKAGNSASKQLNFEYDGTAPVVSASPSRGANAKGWYTSPLMISWSGTDATSGIDTCDSASSFSGPDSATASVTGGCDDKAGNSGSKQFGFKYDATPPQVAAGTTGRSPDGNGWYSHPVTVTWGGTDATSGMDGCTSATYSGPDSSSASVPGGTCHDKAGNSATGSSFALKYDSTPPQITGATVSRSPDTNGWYRHPVAITWKGTDALSGFASCTSTYSGPDSATALAVGTCHDEAGNLASAGFLLKYDATAPVLSKVGVISRAASDLVRWTSTGPADTVFVKRRARGSSDQQVVYQGTGSRFVDTKIQPGLEYEYEIQSTDQAGNVSKKATVTGLPKVLTLRSMPYIPRAAPKPILRWNAVRNASYYHTQLFRGSRRILAAWPSKRELGLTSTWKWGGRRYTLSPGRYRWYVWAGLGKRSFARYQPIGSARFIVPPG